MHKSKIFLYFCLSFILGIFFSSVISLSQRLMLGIFILAILLISVFWKYKKIAVSGFCLFFLGLGVWRYQQVVLKAPLIEEREITFSGVVVKEPDVREKSVKLTVEVKDLSKVLVTTGRYPEYGYGDKLKITGRLEIPKGFPDFNYQGYLAKDGIYSVSYLPEIALLARNQGNFLYAKILQFKNKLREVIEQNLPPPHSSILGAILLGDKRHLSELWQNKLNITGVRHMTCISGMHIIILSGILTWLGVRLGLGRAQVFYFAITLLLLFIIMVGAPASGVRAGIMAGLLLLAQKLGRLRQAGRTLVIAAGVMLVHNPLLLGLDVGFQLSFLATLGIIYLMPVFQTYLQKLTRSGLVSLADLVAMTLAAQVFTLPLLIYNFGYFSLVAPLTNVLLVPFLPYVMGSGLIFVFSGLIWQGFGWVFSLPVWFLLNYVVKIVDWFSQIPWASLNLEVSWIWLAPCYLILGGITAWLVHRQRWQFLEY